MVGLAVVVLWFALVAVYLIRQWWVSELAQAPDGVPAPEPVTLPVAPRPAQSLGVAWNGLYAASSSAR
jgi:hypothetical protein